MSNTGEVTVERDGKQYGATYSVRNGMVQVKTHTETRSVELRDQSPEVVALRVLKEVVDTQGESRH
jgi:hypothetical protein